MQALKSTVFAAVPNIDVMDYTSNVVYLAATASIVRNVQALQAANTVLALRFGTSGPVSALQVDAAASAVGFQVPYELYNVAAVTALQLTLVTLSTSDLLASGAQLRITPVITALQQMATSGVMLREEATLGGGDVFATARFAGAGTATPYTTDVSHVITATLSFSMVNNGAVGGRCTASTSALPYFITRYDVRFIVPSSYAALVHAGRKSVCAMYNGKGTVVAPLSIQHLAATTTAPQFSAAAAIPVTLLGGTTTGIANGAYTAFVSTASDCSSAEADASLLPFNSFSSSSDATAVPDAIVVTPAQTREGRFVCVRRASGGTAFAVTFQGGAVVVGGRAQVPPPSPSAAAAASPVLTIFNGSSGVLGLAEFVRPAASDSDTAAYVAAAAIVSESYRVFRFVGVKAGATDADKKAACARAKQEATRDAANGVMQLSYPLYLQQATGVLCADSVYVRIDYTVVQPQTWLTSMAGTPDFTARTLVLSAGATYDAVPLVAGSSSSGMSGTGVGSAPALRLSPDANCAFGSTARIQLYGTQQYVAVPTAAVGVYAVCVGLYNETGTSVFVSTGLQVALASYAVGRSNWVLNAGVDTTEWTPCGSASTCGQHTEQAYVQVCNGAVRSNVWPQRLEGAFVGVNSLPVLMTGNLLKTQATVLMNDLYVPVAAAFAQCQQFSLLPLSTDDGATYGPAAVVLANNPQIAISSAMAVSGVVMGFVPWDSTCRGDHTGADVMVARTAAGVSVIDMSGLLFAKTEGYFAVCVRNGESWARVTETYIKVVAAASTVYRAEGISTDNAAANENSIQLYQTQTAVWAVIGTFSPSVSLVLKLVWNDATCAADAAYTAAMHYVSPSSANVTVEASLVAAAPVGAPSTPRLYPCYAAASPGAVAAPMPFEAHRGRAITVAPLTLASLFYLPHLSIAVTAPADTRLLLTDPQDPPITFVALQVANDASATPQCGAGAMYATVLAVDMDDLGRRWMTVPAWVPQALGGSGATDAVLKMCATASSSANPEFVAVDAYLVLSAQGTNLAGGPMSLRLTFQPLNTSTDAIDYAAARAALVTYAATQLNVSGAAVLVAALGSNAFELFIDDALKTGAAPDSALTPTQQLYQVLSKGTGLPLVVQGRENTTAWFALAKAEGVQLVDQSAVSDYPALQLPTSGSGTDTSNFAALSIALFCVVVAPTTIGFVAFSVQQTIPTLSHSRFGKKAAVYAETGDSPPPRNPRPAAEREAEGGSGNGGGGPKSDESGVPAVSVPLTVVPRAEDTTQNPLYDSEEEAPAAHEMKDMGSSPPLRNDTFAMAKKGISSRSSGTEDDKR